MTPHTCAESKDCICSMQALEPDENCPKHGWPYPPRCETCGRFMKRLTVDSLKEEVDKLNEEIEHLQIELSLSNKYKDEYRNRYWEKVHEETYLGNLVNKIINVLFN